MRIVPHETRFFRDEELAHDDRYSGDGKTLAAIRANQHLPNNWRQLTPGDLHQIGEFLRRNLLETRTTLSEDVALAIGAVLTTGRSLRSLSRLKLYSAFDELAADASREGLAWDDDQPCWVLVAGSSSRLAERRNSRGLTVGKSDHCVRLPVSPLVKECIERRSSVIANGGERLFRKSEASIAEAIKMALRRRRGEHVGRPRRTSTTLESLERYLTAAITHQVRGGWAEAVRYTDRDEPLARTVIYYGENRLSTAFEAAENATKPLVGERAAPSHFPEDWDAYVGSDHVAADAEVDRLSERLRSKVLANHGSTPETHQAMTNQVVALLSFALGHRGTGDYLPSSTSIDWSSGFCQLHDKECNDPSAARLVWVAHAAEAQIRHYEEYLGRLADGLAPSDARTVRSAIASGKLPFFDLQRDGISELSLAKIWSRIRDLNPGLARFSYNIGRQWLRSKLAGQCSPETLQAFFGHWQLGQEPWSYGSCLDPLLFKRELQKTLPPLLAKHGWAPLKFKLGN